MDPPLLALIFHPIENVTLERISNDCHVEVVPMHLGSHFFSPVCGKRNECVKVLWASLKDFSQLSTVHCSLLLKADALMG